MSYEEFRRRIDTMRQILVGAVPSPAGQIDQITYALMYKFMNDIDDQSAALGGVRTYFTGEYEKYNWHALMSSSLGAHERLELYRQAIQTMAKNENIPELFRSIYQNAFLPFNSANVLTLFLKEADKFSHGETDDIGDAYEYLLSITGAQGDVGQFRTPRHIIKFIAEAVNPTKDDKVLDPAVGTAGFLIAAYNHVQSQHDGKDKDGSVNDEKRLTADELDKIHHNYRGFDIDPTMVRTAKVNMYLHGFPSPDIINHDSLSSEEYWNDRYDVILANPPFMTPKGGIQPHKKFGISANRAEVLFVDYIASHLKPTGRAGIVVPEGIIFQSGKAYKELRKNLVENYLYAVVSLPAGVFNPYAGVKTSVLLLDKELAKQRDEILFVKVENDGYSLGAQRRPIAGNQFPEALELIEKFKTGEEFASEFAHTVSRNEIWESGDYNLSGDRYKLVSAKIHADYPTFSLEELEKENKISFFRGHNLSKKDLLPSGKYKCIHYGELYTLYDPIIKEVVSRTDVESKTTSEKGDVLVPATTTAGPDGIAVARSLNEDGVVIGGDINVIRTKNEFILADYLSWVINYPLKKTLSTYATGVNIYHLSNNDLRKLKVIVPPLEIQREIVAELDGYQKIIDAAQTIVQAYKPTIKINPEWESVELSAVCDLGRGFAFKSSDYRDSGIASFRVTNIGKDGLPDRRDLKYLPESFAEEYAKYLLKDGDFVIVMVGATTGKIGLITSDILPALLNQNMWKFIPDESKLLKKFLFYLAPSLAAISQGGAQGYLTQSTFMRQNIPLPPIETQREIVAELEAEQKLIDASKKLIEIYQQKIKSKIAEVWGE